MKKIIILLLLLLCINCVNSVAPDINKINVETIGVSYIQFKELNLGKYDAKYKIKNLSGTNIRKWQFDYIIYGSKIRHNIYMITIDGCDLKKGMEAIGYFTILTRGDNIRETEIKNIILK